MRVQLARASFLVGLAVLTAAAAAGPAAADEFVTKTQIYTDSDHTTVVSPLVRISKDAWRGGTLGASFVADVVSSASVDVVTNATTHMTDFRREVSGSLTQRISETTLSGAYIFSNENDYTSHNMALGVAQDLLQKNTTLALGYGYSWNEVGRSGEANFHCVGQPQGPCLLQVHNIDATWTQVLTPKTLMQAGYSFQYALGYQASPYRFVHTESGVTVPETDPDRRARHAFVLALKRHVASDSALEASYRFYFDDWGVMSHTAILQYTIDFERVTLRLRERFYYQNGASFFQSQYTDASSPYITADRELSTFFANVAGVKLIFKLDRLFAGLSLEAKADVFYYYYVDFIPLPYRVGGNLEAGLSLRF
jgi:hypothetical protein